MVCSAEESLKGSNASSTTKKICYSSGRDHTAGQQQIAGRAVLSIRLMRLKPQGPQSLGAHQNLESSFIDHHFQPQGPQSLGAHQNLESSFIDHHFYAAYFTCVRLQRTFLRSS